MKYNIRTLGCKFNQYESAHIDELLKAAGYSPSSAEEADFIILNSCAVTSEATRQSIQTARHLKKINANAKIIFTGCAVHDEKIDEFDLVLGNGEKIEILKYMNSTGIIEDKGYFLDDSLNYSIDRIPDHTRAFLSVENGCNWGCTYCAVPHFRGTRIRSKPLKTAIEEAEKMVRNGTKEIVISGINIALYDDNGSNLKTLLARMLEIDGNFRIRISSIDPLSVFNFTDLFDNSKLCHHLHISLQSGADKILEMMGRHYTGHDALKLVNELRERDQEFAFSADVIVGFPGEGAEEFKETFDLLSEMRVSRIHVFPFSPRSSTLAATMEDNVSNFEKKERVTRLKELSKTLETNFRKRSHGKKQRILVEKIKNGFCEGLDDHYIRYNVKCAGRIGEFIECEV